MTEELIHRVCSASCLKLSGTGTLKYSVGLDGRRQPHFRIDSNDGGGFFSREWVAWKDVRATCEKAAPVTSAALVKLFTHKSANMPGFLLAVLVALKLLEPLPDKTRHFRLLDPAPFYDRLAKLAKSTKPAAPKPAKRANTKKSPPKKKAK